VPLLSVLVAEVIAGSIGGICGSTGKTSILEVCQVTFAVTELLRVVKFISNQFG